MYHAIHAATFQMFNLIQVENNGVLLAVSLSVGLVADKRLFYLN